MPKPRKQYRRPRRKFAGRKNRYAPKRYKQLSFALPQSMVIKMRYYERISIDPGAVGAIAGAIYRANGLFDPSATFTGHQPQSYDTWLGADNSGSLYKEFVVLGSKIKVEFIAQSATEVNRVGITLQDSSSVAAGVTEANEDRATVRGNLGTTAGRSAVTLYKNFSAKRWFRHKSVTDERDTHGTYSNDPSRQAYFSVWAEGMGTDTTAIKALVTIDYIVMLRQPAKLPPS